MTNQTRAASVLELEAIFQQELATDRWAAAESAYALASRYRDEGDWEKSREWVKQCLQLLEGFPPTRWSRSPPPARPSAVPRCRTTFTRASCVNASANSPDIHAHR